MRSPRSRVEWGCRIAAFALLGWLLGQSVVPSPPRVVESARGADVTSRLAEWTRAPSSVALHAELSTAPDERTTDWLAALAHSGHAVTWSGSPPPLALDAEPLADPHGGARINIAAPAGSALSMRDAAGPLDSLRVANLGGSIIAPLVAGAIDGMTTTGQQLSAPAPVAATIRSVLVVGQAGWEGKFAAAALQERGWPVVTRFTVSPRVDVDAGSALPLDTARVAAVVVLDSSVATPLGAALERYVRSGGGLVLAGDAARATAIASLAPGSLGARVRPASLPSDTIGLGATGFYPVSLASAGVALDRRAGGVSIASRRVGAGRVIELGFDDSWRWRMAGGPGSEAAHREWWTRIVGSVAYAPSPSASIDVASAAPLADLVDRLGPARAVRAGASGWRIDQRLLLTLILILLSVEWASRRLRGLR